MTTLCDTPQTSQARLKSYTKGDVVGFYNILICVIIHCLNSTIMKS